MAGHLLSSTSTLLAGRISTLRLGRVSEALPVVWEDDQRGKTSKTSKTVTGRA